MVWGRDKDAVKSTHSLKIRYTEPDNWADAQVWTTRKCGLTVRWSNRYDLQLRDIQLSNASCVVVVIFGFWLVTCISLDYSTF